MKAVGKAVRHVRKPPDGEGEPSLPLDPVERDRRGKRAHVYDPAYCVSARALAYVGASQRMIAEYIGVQPATIASWTRKHPEFAAALTEGRHAVAEVTHALYRRAVGYEYEETVEETMEDDEGRLVRKSKRMKKQRIPDVKAQIFWLTNRAPDWWAETKVSLENGEELTRVLAEGMRRAASYDKGGAIDVPFEEEGTGEKLPVPATRGGDE